MKTNYFHRQSSLVDKTLLPGNIDMNAKLEQVDHTPENRICLIGQGAIQVSTSSLGEHGHDRHNVEMSFVEIDTNMTEVESG